MIKQISKKLYILSAAALFNLLAVIVISNFISQKPNLEKTYPTPIIKVNKTVKKVTQFVTPMPINTDLTLIQSPKPMVTEKANTGNCVVTIDGQKYDVFEFKKIHSGGDIFKCGTDSSSEFWSRHGQKELSKMQRYRI